MHAGERMHDTQALLWWSMRGAGYDVRGEAQRLRASNRGVENPVAPKTAATATPGTI